MYAYEQLMEENDLKQSDLPKDAQIGIKSIKQIENAILMTEKRGQKVSDATKDKLRTNDKWVTGEILAFLDDRETQQELPHEAKEVIQEIKEESVEMSPEEKIGYSIDQELEKLFESGETRFDINQIKGVAPKTFRQVFDTYSEDEPNGVETSNFRFVESDEELLFNLNKL